MKPDRRQSAFSLIEFLVIIAIFALLALIIYPALRPRGTVSPLIATQAKIKQLGAVSIIFHEANGRWPSQDAWQHEVKQYLGSDDFTDAWGSELRYRMTDVPFFYSIGENLQDERGGGDDVTLIHDIAKFRSHLEQQPQ